MFFAFLLTFVWCSEIEASSKVSLDLSLSISWNLAWLEIYKQIRSCNNGMYNFQIEFKDEPK